MNDIDISVRKVIDMVQKIPNNYEEISQRIPYYNMVATLTDAVLQAGMNYKTVVYPRVLNILKRFPDYKTTCDFIILFQFVPIEEIIGINNGRKKNAIIELAWVLYKYGVNTEDDLAAWLKDVGNKSKLLEINGIGKKTIDYLELLAGEQAIPIDRHMFEFLRMAGVVTTKYDEASRVMCRTAEAMGVEKSILDNIVWNYMSNMASGKMVVE